MVRIGKKKAYPGFDVQIVSPRDGATVKRGKIPITIKASFLGLPMPLVPCIWLYWAKKGERYSLFKNKSLARRFSPFSTTYKGTITIEEPGEWKILASVPVTFILATHEIEINVV